MKSFFDVPAVAAATLAGGLVLMHFLGANDVAAQSAPRGQLLYDNHCLECHNQQVHWRDQRLVTNWESLKHWVRHWQREGRLNWSDDEINDVAQHLNNHFYRFRPPGAVRG